jgi:sec-independent protein translocase protein TatA
MIGIWQLILIIIFCIVVFGAGKIPRVMGDIGAGIRAFKKSLLEDDKDSKHNLRKKLKPKKTLKSSSKKRK